VSEGRAIVETSLDDLRSDDVRFLEEAARLGPLHVRVPTDALLTGRGTVPRFPQAERLFLARSLRWVHTAELVDEPLAVSPAALAVLAAAGVTVAVRGEEEEDGHLASAAEAAGVAARVIDAQARAGFPLHEPEPLPADARTVIVTGCFDWVHSGHVRFFMDAAAFGPLYVVVGSDRNVRLLKGEGHPLQTEHERRYMVGSMKPVYLSLISTGSGWMDAEPEIEVLRPTFYVVNEDGDQPEKRRFCEAHGLRYTVLQRLPHEGLPPRSSTDLRGF
jgi:cytidyltransferase-like protein